ncbi:hypothetical protein [Glaesserella parasuis]|uniref:hypothetical protein n=1 Tax=Glaesserella parasuis TaxID=738 RepID=UPI00136661DB|nr:hypothetical protein [Glaesserella parasuis]MDG6369462.1 hypothetical protein [Glaesserella parasuis]MDG6844390.1 hypothetical protein [Glaesserella parasuis]MDO9656715.1 hypothetical protein [Glaesserella parasuis]MDO9659129.1 hypothetical protein [Glaesserella parasuis]MDO9667914.1 hypothetical protein [Glaesserella parasuis]
MNRKIIFSPNSNEQFEIQHTVTNGYRVFRLTEHGKISQIGDLYRNATELTEGLVQLAIFSGEEDGTLADVSNAIQSVADTIKEYCTLNAGYDC